MERVGFDFGAYVLDGGLHYLEFDVPAETEEGDQLALLVVGRGSPQNDNHDLDVTPPADENWTVEATAAQVDDWFQDAAFCSRPAVEGDAGATFRVQVNVAIDGGGKAPVAGILVVYRGGVLPVLVQGVASLAVQDDGAIANHVSPAVVATQAGDRRLTIWYVLEAGDITPPVASASIEVLGQVADATAQIDIAAIEYVAPALGSLPGLTLTSSTGRFGASATAAIRAKPVVAAEGLVPSSTPGRIGLVL